ncbi:hypothetical protein BHM03_00040831 [Ensete ventricosum]|nr:hypothetical protein BHM03_00040831 [Ensete ventricosum]
MQVVATSAASPHHCSTFFPPCSYRRPTSPQPQPPLGASHADATASSLSRYRSPRRTVVALTFLLRFPAEPCCRSPRRTPSPAPVILNRRLLSSSSTHPSLTLPPSSSYASSPRPVAAANYRSQPLPSPPISSASGGFSTHCYHCRNLPFLVSCRSSRTSPLPSPSAASSSDHLCSSLPSTAATTSSSTAALASSSKKTIAAVASLAGHGHCLLPSVIAVLTTTTCCCLLLTIS